MTEPHPPAPSNATEFCALFERLKLGDQDAAGELHARFGSSLRNCVRVLLRRRQYERFLRRKLDSTDLTQEVWIELWQKAADDEVTFHDPAALMAFLKQMANYKVCEARRHYLGTDKRDCRREAALDENPSGVV